MPSNQFEASSKRGPSAQDFWFKELFAEPLSGVKSLRAVEGVPSDSPVPVEDWSSVIQRALKPPLNFAVSFLPQ